MSFKWDRSGRRDIVQNLRNITESIEPAAADVLLETAETILMLSQTKVPVKTGNLRSTGDAYLTRRGKREVKAAVSYGGSGQAPYAIYIHERLTLNHPNGGQAKYLQQPMLQMMGRLGPFWAREIGDRLRM